MRKIKKFLAIILATLMVMSVAAFSASAAENPPEFKVSLVSETDSTVVIRVALVSGKFNSLDFTVYTSSSITGCTKFEQTKEFKDVTLDYIINKGDTLVVVQNAATKKAGIASVLGIDTPVDIYEITLTKKTSAPVKNTDIGLVIDSCTVSSSNSSNGNKPVDVTDSVKVSVALQSFNLSETSVSMNYKDSHTIGYETNYAEGDLTWTSSDEGVVTVDENGNIYATGTGSATITVTSADGAVNETIEVTVSYTVIQWIIIIVLFGWIWY